MKDIYAILDIGSSAVKLVVGESFNKIIYVLFAKSIPNSGIRKGKIIDEATVAENIRTLIAEANEALGASIDSVGITLPGEYIHLYHGCQGSISFGSKGKVIEQEDLVRVLRTSSKIEKRDNEEIVSVIPERYHHDEASSDETPPIGKFSRNLAVDSFVATMDRHILMQYLRVVEKAGVQVLEICVNSYACAKETFDTVYLQDGAILVDLGGTSSTVSFFKDNSLKKLDVCYAGGHDFTKAIAANMMIPMSQAESYKVKYGSLSEDIGENDIIHTTMIGDQLKEFTQSDLNEILLNSVQEVLTKIKGYVERIDQHEKYNIILVGGGCELNMIDKVAEGIFNSHVKVYRPEKIGARDICYVSCLGMIYYLTDYGNIVGKYAPSVVLPDMSNTVVTRFKGLTTVEEKPSIFKKFMKNIFDDIEDE